MREYLSGILHDPMPFRIRVFFNSITFLIIFFCTELSAQNIEIAEVRFEGNKRTKTGFLRKIIETEEGTVPDTMTIENDLRRLRTLSSVMNAKVVEEETDSGLVITFRIEERLTILPVGDFGISNNNYWFGAGAMQTNLAGRGMYVYAFYHYNVHHSLHLIFRDPFLFGRRHGLEFQLRRQPTHEDNLTDTLLHNGFLEMYAAFKYQIEYENDLLPGIGYRKINGRLKSGENFLPVDDSLKTRHSVFIFLKKHSQRLDNHYFYVAGWQNKFHVELAFGTMDPYKKMFMVYNDFRYYWRSPYKGNLATRVLLGFSTEDQHVFSPFIIDSYQNIRGTGYRADKGNAVGLMSMEYRQTLYENKIGGIQLVVFSDNAVIKRTYQVYDRLLTENFKIYGGAGLRLIYKRAYNAILSIDYGWDLQALTRGGWVVGLGQYF